MRAELGRLLQEITPGNLTKAFFTNGGAEANENAIKIARWVTGRQKIIARYRSYHGATAGAITLTGDPRRWAAEPGIPGVVRAMDPYRYRCRWCGDKPACTMDCLNHIEDIITFEGPQTIAAVIVESVVGTNGLIIPPDGYLQGLRELCTKHGIMLICDEIMSGFGRTGEWFAVDHWGVMPDIMTVAKGLTSAYVPLGATIVTDKIAAQFDDKPLYAGLTYNSHSVGCAAAVACINVYKEDHLIENAEGDGRDPRRGVEQAQGEAPIGRRRARDRPLQPGGAGEEPRDARADDALQPEGVRAWPDAAAQRLLPRAGLLHLRALERLLRQPAALITEEQLREGLAIIDAGLEITDRAVS